jgi:hypothetical protein
MSTTALTRVFEDFPSVATQRSIISVVIASIGSSPHSGSCALTIDR